MYEALRQRQLILTAVKTRMCLHHGQFPGFLAPHRAQGMCESLERISIGGLVVEDQQVRFKQNINSE